jgi:hypothetical protein
VTIGGREKRQICRAQMLLRHAAANCMLDICWTSPIRECRFGRLPDPDTDCCSVVSGYQILDDDVACVRRHPSRGIASPASQCLPIQESYLSASSSPYLWFYYVSML